MPVSPVPPVELNPSSATVKDQRALEMYEFMRLGNPHLPEASKVSAWQPITITFGPEHVTTMTITVVIELPQGGEDDGSAEAQA